MDGWVFIWWVSEKVDENVDEILFLFVVDFIGVLILLVELVGLKKEFEKLKGEV